MAPPARPRFTPATRRHRASPAPPTLVLPDSAVTALHRNASTSGSEPAPRVLNISALDKCSHDMSPADFRTWRRSVEDWLRLNEVKDQQGVCYIRLLCVPAVQKALDARYPRNKWTALCPAQGSLT